MADDKQTIVIKKINVDAGAGHGGSWKVALADFMTALMCFFLVMWLVNQPEDVKQNVASYFTGPSMIEQEFSSYGAELTLEKLFLDLVNEPLRAIQEFLMPADFTPSLMRMGTKKIVLMEIAEKIGSVANNVVVESDEIEFEIPDRFLFLPGGSQPTGQFVQIMDNVKDLTAGLEDSEVIITSSLYQQSVGDGTYVMAQYIGSKRRDLVKAQVESSLEHPNVDITGRVEILTLAKNQFGRPGGAIKFKIKQKEMLSDGRKPRPIQGDVGNRNREMSVYDDFVDRISKKKKE